MDDFDDIHDPLQQIYTDEMVELLQDLAGKVELREATRGAIRVLLKDGGHQDLVWGYETEDERLALLAMIEKQIEGGSPH